MSLGTFLTNLEAAALSVGRSVTTRYSEYLPTEVAVSLDPSSSEATFDWRPAMTARRSVRRPFNNESLPPDLAPALLDPIGSARLRQIRDSSEHGWLLGRFRLATLAVFQDRSFRHELAQWLRPNDTNLADGMPGYAQGFTDRQSKIMPWLIRLGVGGNKAVDAQYGTVASGAHLVLLVAADNSPAAWIDAGRTYEWVSLRVVRQGLASSSFAAIAEVPKISDEIVKTLRLEGVPAALLRIGNPGPAPLAPVTPRRSISELLEARPPTGGSPVTASETRRQHSRDAVIATLTCEVERGEVEVGRFRLPYIASGSGDPIILLHGANLGLAQWHKNVDALSKVGRVIALDMPGAGAATLLDYFDLNYRYDLLDPVTEMLRRLRIQKPTLVGTSIGGWVAMRLVLDERVAARRLVLVDAVGFSRTVPGNQVPISFRPFAKLLSRTALHPSGHNPRLESFMRAVFFDKKLDLSDEFLAFYQLLNTESESLKLIHRIAHDVRGELQISQAELARIAVPTCVIWGDSDPLMPFETVEDLIKLIPSVAIHKIRNAGHMPPLEDPDTFNTIVAEFIRAT
jgi:pimeloyl-ACP methyl ester carboxylesterase